MARLSLSSNQSDSASRMPWTLRGFLAHDGVPVGGIAVALMLGTYALLGLPVDGPLLVLGGCGTAIIYQLDRVLAHSPEDRINRPRRTQWMRSQRRYVWATIAGATGLGAAMLLLVRPVTAVVGGGLGVVGLVHVWPVLHGGRRLKAWGRLKPLAISSVWALGGVLLPVLEAGHALTTGVGALVAYRLAFIAVNTLLADWGDRTGDIQAGLSTWAAQAPPAQVFRLAYIVLALLLVGGLGAVGAGAAPRVLLVDLVGLMLMAGLVRRAQHDAAWARHIAIDAVVAWPAVTFWVARITG